MTKQIITTNALSKHELEMVKFIHEFGFCEIRHIMKRFSKRRTTSYEQMKILIRLGMINYRLVLPNHPGVYSLTSKAVRFLDTDLPTMTFIPTNYYFHYMEVLNIYLKIHERLPESVWITERRLIRQKYENLRGNKEHLPDGVLVLPNERRIAIEVELTLKTRKRLLDILTDYVVDKDIHEVWYFCSPTLIHVIREMAATFTKIKTYLIDEELV